MGWSRTPVEPLRWWVQKVLPTVYDDSLSFQELLGKVVNKLNEVIEQGSALAEYVNTNFTEIREEIADFMTEDEVTNLVNGVAETLRTDYLERLRVVQNDIAALVTTKVDKITTTGPEKVYTVTGSTQGSRECWESSVANSIIKRDQNGRAQISNPLSDYDITNKGYVDTELSFVKNLVVSGNNNKVLAIMNGSLVAVPVTDLIANGDEVRY